MDELTTTERETLDGLVQTVKRGMTTFVDVGTALRRIRDERLWRVRAASFEAFCETEFDFGKRRANQIIAEAQAARDAVSPASGKHVSQSGDSVKKTQVSPNARQSAVIAKVPVAERAKVWQDAVETAPKDDAGEPKVTAAHVRRVVAETVEPTPSPTSKPVIEAKPAEPWQQTAADVLRIIGTLTAIAEDMRQSFGAVSKGKSERVLTFPGALRYSWSGTIGHVNTIIKYLGDEMPVGADAQGIITAADRQKAEKLGRRAS